MKNQFDVYEMVTDKICALLEKGLIPWEMPWSANTTNHAWSRQTGRPYSLINHLLLADKEKNYKNIYELLEDVKGEYLTFNQVKKLGGSVKAGEKGKTVIFFEWLEKETDKIDEETGEPIINKIPILKYYYVFKVEQCTGIEPKHHTDDGQTYDFTQDLTAEEVANDYLNRSGVKLQNIRQDKAYYTPATDTITMPMQDQFKQSNEYYSTLFHEMTHSTGHPSRLNRVKKVSAFGDEEYSTEELVAEIGAASIMATIGLDTSDSLKNSAAYIQSWLKALKNDKKMIVFASARAEKAIKLILNIEQGETA
jgi:antirestriction protein ArdC